MAASEFAGADSASFRTEVTIGDFLKIGFADGQTASVQVADLDEEKVTPDANHPLAGRDLTFALTLVAIQ